VLEDVPTDAELAVREVRRAEIECTSLRVDAPEEFLRALHEFAPDVVLADYSLPQMTALDALQTLREHGLDLPFILFTGSQSEETAARCMREGADDYVLKANLRRLPAAIVNALERSLARRERVRMEEALRRSEERHRLIAEHTLDLIGVLDAGGKFLYVSPSVQGILGCPAEALLGTGILAMTHADDRPLVERALVRQPPRGAFRDMVFRLRHTDGSWRTVEVSGRWTADPAEPGPTVVLIARDITDRVRLEAQLRQSQKMEEIGTLAGGIAHDFNNLLGIILGHAYLLDKGTPHEGRQRESLDAITTTVRRGTSLVRQLLTFARKSEPSVEPVRLEPVVMELAAMLRETLPRSIAVVTEIAPHLPSIAIDQNQIHQALLNLAINARDAMPSGGTLTIGVSRCSGCTLTEAGVDAPSGCIRLSVTDSGVGMDEETRSRLFEPFFTTKEHGKGTGLGLAVVYGIIRGHNGRIDVDTQPGKGTTFRLHLPAPDVPVAVEPTKDGVDAVHLAGTALIVEDEPLLLHLLTTILGERGWAYHTAKDGEEAVEVFRRNAGTVDVVVSDVGLPRLGGFEAFARMRSMAPNLHGVFASGYFDPGTRRKLGSDGVTALIQKPYRPAEIVEAAARALAAARAARNPERRTA
jgi:PAS domain S-box-containing protein